MSTGEDKKNSTEATESAVVPISEGLESDLTAEEPSGEQTLPDEKKASETADSYLDEDEQFINDKILLETDEQVVAQQEDGVVNWSIEGLYTPNGKVKSKRLLKIDPPVLAIESNTGERAQFVLTKELSGLLAELFDTTHRAYYGIRPKNQLTFRQKLKEIWGKRKKK